MSQRLPPPDPGALSGEASGLLALTAMNGGPPATIELLAHSPHLLAPFLGWAAALARSGTLPERDHEILALRASHLCRSEFEWVEHSGFALAAGLSAAEIEAVRTGSDHHAWTDHDRALLDATDELHRDGAVGAATYAALEAHYDRAALVEIPMVVGQYTMLSMLTGFFAVPARPEEHPDDD